VAVQEHGRVVGERAVERGERAGGVVAGGVVEPARAGDGVALAAVVDPVDLVERAEACPRK